MIPSVASSHDTRPAHAEALVLARFCFGLALSHKGWVRRRKGGWGDPMNTVCGAKQYTRIWEMESGLAKGSREPDGLFALDYGDSRK